MIIEDITKALNRGEYREEFFGLIPQVPQYVNFHYVHSGRTERECVGHGLAEPDMDFMGIKVYQSDAMGKSTPVRVHKEALRHVHSGWMTGTVPARGPNYHKRIQKKWNKRFGFTVTPIFALVAGGQIILVSPVGLAMLAADKQLYYNLGGGL